MTSATVLRPAVAGDASDLAILLDAASRRLVSYLWNGIAVSGQSVFEVGRGRILMNKQSPSHYANWQVAELDGQVAGGLAGYVMDDPYDLAIADEYPAAFRPMFADHTDHRKLQHPCDSGLSAPWLQGVGPPDLHSLRRH